MAVLLDELPSFSCLETVQRSVRGARSTKLALVDTLRLEVGFVGGKEVYSWPGVKRFNESTLSDLVGTGLTSNGEFASHARNIFLNNVAAVSFQGEELLRGHHAAKYRYRIPAMFSAWRLTFSGRSGLASSQGLFWVDTESLELLRLEIDADQIPPEIPVRSVHIQIDYGRTKLGEKAFWIPETAQLLWEDYTGAAGRNDVAFSHCRTFRTDSSISFGDTPSPDPIPANLTLDLQLTTPVDSSKSSSGDEILARVTRDVLRRGKVVVPQGAVVYGRIRRLERYADPQPHYVVGLELTEITFAGKTAPFTGRLEKFSGHGTMALSPDTANFETTLQGVGSFVVPADSFILDNKFQMTWRTRETK